MEDRLSFPATRLELTGRIVEEYVIPMDKKVKVLAELHWPETPPEMDTMMLNAIANRPS